MPDKTPEERLAGHDARLDNVESGVSEIRADSKDLYKLHRDLMTSQASTQANLDRAAASIAESAEMQKEGKKDLSTNAIQLAAHDVKLDNITIVIQNISKIGMYLILVILLSSVGWWVTSLNTVNAGTTAPVIDPTGIVSMPPSPTGINPKP